MPCTVTNTENDILFTGRSLFECMSFVEQACEEMAADNDDEGNGSDDAYIYAVGMLILDADGNVVGSAANGFSC